MPITPCPTCGGIEESCPICPIAIDWGATGVFDLGVQVNNVTQFTNPLAGGAVFTPADEAKLDFLTITQAVDLDAVELRVNELDASVVLMGTWDASVGSFPGGGTAQAGESWIVSVGGTVNGVAFVANDRIVAIVDNAPTGIYAGNWHKLDYTDQVLSVGGLTGAVSLAALGLTVGSDIQAWSAILDATTAVFTLAQEDKLDEVTVNANGVIVGGLANSIINGTQHGIFASWSSDITSTGQNGVIAGGVNGLISGSGNYNALIGGNANVISSTGHNNSVIGGGGSEITAGTAHGIFASTNSDITGSNRNVIVGSTLDLISASGNDNGIFASNNGDIIGTSGRSSLLAGEGNTINNALNAAIVGGHTNTNTHNQAVMLGCTSRASLSDHIAHVEGLHCFADYVSMPNLPVAAGAAGRLYVDGSGFVKQS